MRLFDAVMSSPTHIKLVGNGRETVLPGVGSCRERLRECHHRYVLDDAAARVVADEALGGSRVVADAVDILRMPGGSVWLEWRESPELYRNRDESATRRQVGLLIEADETLRRGQVTSFWKAGDAPAMVSPGRIAFDLDDAPSSGVRIATSDRGHPVDELFSHASLTFDQEWLAYYTAGGFGAASSLHEAILKQVAPDWPMAASFAMLMMASDVFDRRALSLEKLNRQREKAGKHRLSDMTELSLRWSSGESERSDGMQRADGPRLHHVRGHLVRRRDQVFWRRPHLRGSGLPKHVPLRRVSPRR